VAVARQFVVDTLGKWGIDGSIQEAATLLVSELVTNAVIHARTEIVLTLCNEGPQIRFEIRDGSNRPPVDSTVPPSSTSGRGVHVVAAMSDDWGVESVDGDGKTVWFTLKYP
jgi:anti-sigma regulatory factor (Ser/Thr protein kinase)